MELMLLAQTGASAHPLAASLILGPLYLVIGLHAIKVKRLGKRTFYLTGKLAVYGGYVFCITGLALLLLGLLSTLFSQQIIPVYNTLLGFIVYGWFVAYLFIRVLSVFRFGDD